MRETIGAVTATLAEDIAGMRVLQSFTRERAAKENFRQVSDTLPRSRTCRRSSSPGSTSRSLDFLSSASTAVVLGYGGWLVWHGDASIGTLVAFLGYLANFFDPVQQLSQLYNTFLSAVAALDKITDLLDEEPEVVDAAGAAALGSIAGRVRFEDVRFSYGRGSGGAARRLARRSRRHDRRARRAHRRGQVDDREAARALLRPDRRARSRSTAPTCATSPRSRCAGSSGSSRRRASCSRAPRPRTSRSRGPTRRARRSSRPRAPSAPTSSSGSSRTGYDTQLGERGSRLSLGQRQLVAFARALLADPRILILDEATSSVDIGTERKIEIALRRLLHDRTAFIIAHRLSTIREADLIVVLEHGLVIEQGTHAELLAAQAASTPACTATGPKRPRSRARVESAT